MTSTNRASTIPASMISVLLIVADRKITPPLLSFNLICDSASLAIRASQTYPTSYFLADFRS